MKEKTIISIITPCYNSAKNIEECLKSVIHQTLIAIEHIFIDNESIDQTVGIIEKYATASKNIKYISEKYTGMYDAINKGISLAKGEWIYILGSDDTLYSNTTLENIASRLLLDDTDVVYGNVVWGKEKKIYDGLFTYEKLLSRNICQRGIFYKKEIFNRLGLFDTRYPAFADWVYTIKWFCDPHITHSYTEEIIANYNPDGCLAVTTDQNFVIDQYRIIEQYFPKEFVKIFRLEKEVSRLTESSKLSADLVISLDTTVEHLYACIEKLESENAHLNHKLGESRSENARRDYELNKIRNSVIWKAVKPLRKLSRSIRKRTRWIKSRLNTSGKINNDATLNQALPCNITEFFNSYCTSSQGLAGHNEPEKTPVDIYIILSSSISDTQLLCSSIAQNTTEPCTITFFIKDSLDADSVQDILEKLKINGTIIEISGKNQTTLLHDQLSNSDNHFIIAEGITAVPMGWTKKLLSPIREDDTIVSTTPSFRDKSFFESAVSDIIKKFNLHASKECFDDFFYSFDAREDNCSYLPETSWCYAINKDRYKVSGQLHEHTESIREHLVYFIAQQTRIPKNKALIISSCFTSTSGSAADTRPALHNDHFFSSIISFHPGEDDDRVMDALFSLFLCASNESSATQTLFIDHDLGGGANLYSNKFIEEKIKCGDSIFLYTYKYQEKIYDLTSISQSRKVSFQSKQLEHITQLILRFTKINTIIFSESVSFPRVYSLLSQILSIKNRLNITLTALIHDYFYICPSYTLLDHNDEFCNLPENISICQNCMAEHRGDFTLLYQNVEIVLWRKKWLYFLMNCDAIICFSNSSKHLLLKAYADIADDKVAVIPHNVEHFTKKEAEPTKKACDKHRVTIGVLGHIGMHKGSLIIHEMLQIIMDENRQVNMVVVGLITPETTNPNLSVTGQYAHSELQDIIHSHAVDIFLMPSICPETFSYTTHEIIEMGYPLAAFNIGAQGEIVANYEKGLILHTIDARFALDAIENHLASLSKIPV